MISKQVMTFREVTAPIAESVTKFGGQPVWEESPCWPLSRSTGEPLRFMCQIALDPALFGAQPTRMAYLFLNDEADNSFDAESGENAVVLQPGRFAGRFSATATGPSLEKGVLNAATITLEMVAAEFAVELTPGEDPDIFSEPREGADEEEFEAYYDAINQNKIGGAPAFLQVPEYPAGEDARLLLQLDSADAPFDVNFGDSGVAYVFLAADGASGKFIWQSA